MLGGMCLLGISVSLIFVPLLSEIIESVMEKEGCDENPSLNDKASAMFNAAYATGCIVAPIIGGALNSSYGFRNTCDVMAFASATIAIIYFVLVIIPGLCQKKKESRKTMETEKLDASVIDRSESNELVKPMLN